MKPMFVNGMAALFFVNSQIADFYPKVNSVCSTFLRFASHRVGDVQRQCKQIGLLLLGKNWLIDDPAAHPSANRYSTEGGRMVG